MNSVSPGGQEKEPLTLVRVEAVEAESVREMAIRIWPSAYAGIISTAQITYMLDRMYATDRLRDEIENAGIAYYWIDVAGERIGFLAAGPAATGSACPLHKLYLLPASQGCGHGKAALERLIPLIATIGATALELRVNRHNTRAIALYCKTGFEVYDEECVAIGGGFVMDDFLMRRSLDV